MERKVLHVWSGPRSLSTCTMYSFAQREDCKVLDEPLYASFLKENPSLYRPYREELLAVELTDPNAVLEKIAKLSSSINLIYAKHMAKHLTHGINREFLFNSFSKHLLLIRDPFEMIASWSNKQEIHQEGCSLEATCLPKLISIFSEVRERSGSPPIVIDVDLIKRYPEQVLIKACELLGISFDPKQLRWEAGPKPDIDGLWAPYWYDDVHKSSGFNIISESYSNKKKIYPSMSPQQLSIYREALPYYMMLRTYAIGVDTLNPGSTNTSIYRSPSIKSTVDRLADIRNADILVWVGDRLLPRELAKVSVFDSSVQGGDAVWEGLRVYNNAVFQLEAHLQRLKDSAKAMDFHSIPPPSFFREAIGRTLTANGMTDDVHIRLTLTRGPKITSSMNPIFNLFGCNLIVLPEWKPVGNAATYNNVDGVSLVTAANRRNSPECVDSKIHHCNLINNILPKIQANYAGAADALMLGCDGFVSETNATNVFIVKAGEVLTPSADFCLPGVTRGVVIDLVPKLGLRMTERRISLAECHSADEMFTTGTMGELTPVVRLDGRVIGEGKRGPVTVQIQERYRLLVLSGEGSVLISEL